MKLNVSFPLNNTSYGLAGFHIWEELDKLGVDQCLFPIGNVNFNTFPPHLQDLFRRTFYQARRPSLFVDAPSLKLWHQHSIQESVVSKGPKVAYTIFELDRLTPLEQDLCAAYDLVITSNSYHTKVLEKYGCRAAYVPLGVDRSIFNEDIDCWGWEDKYLNSNQSFLTKHETEPTVFAHIGKAEYRKGIDVIKTAFERAFKPGDNVVLLLLTHNPFLIEYDREGRIVRDGNSDWINYYKQSSHSDHFVFLDRLPSQSDVAHLMKAADCLLAPSRSEGYNLEVAEMLATGGWVILTDCTAHSDFISQNTKAFELPDISNPERTALHPLWIDMEDEASEPAVDGTRFFQGQGNWYKIGESQINQMIDRMQTIHRIKQEAGSLPMNTEGIELSRAHSWSACAQGIINSLQKASLRA